MCGGSDHEIVGTGVDFEYESCDNVHHYVRCSECGHHYLNPLPDPSELETIYPPSYGNYSNSVNPGLAFKVKGWLEGRSLKRFGAGLPPGAAVLDIGSGNGRLLDGMKMHCPNVEVLEGIEISDTAAKAAKEKGYEIEVGSIDDIVPKPERYDLVCLIQVIEHVFDPVGCVKKIHEMLKPGGVVLFETPSTRCVDFWLFRRRYWGGYHFPRHLNLFEPDGFSKLLERSGFEIVSVGHKLQPVHWVWTCHHYFKEKGFPRWWTEAFNIRNPLYLGIFTLIDALQVVFLRRSSNMQIVARKERPL